MMQLWQGLVTVFVFCAPGLLMFLARSFLNVAHSRWVSFLLIGLVTALLMPVLREHGGIAILGLIAALVVKTIRIRSSYSLGRRHRRRRAFYD